MRESRGWFGKVDGITVLLYAGLVLFGWLNIYAAVFNEEFGNIWDTSQEYGKQLLFIGAGVVLILVVLLSDARLYELLSIPIYVITLALLALVLVAGKEVGRPPGAEGGADEAQLRQEELLPGEEGRVRPP